MFKTVERRITTGEICQITEETKQNLIDQGIVLIDFSVDHIHPSKAYVIDQGGDMQLVWLGCYIAKEPGGKGYYRIDEETANKIFVLEPDEPGQCF